MKVIASLCQPTLHGPQVNIRYGFGPSADVFTGNHHDTFERIFGSSGTKPVQLQQLGLVTTVDRGYDMLRFTDHSVTVGTSPRLS